MIPKHPKYIAVTMVWWKRHVISLIKDIQICRGIEQRVDLRNQTAVDVYVQTARCDY
jgi:hypothetical protein